MDEFSVMLADLQSLIRIPSVKDQPAPDAPYGKEIKNALDFMLKLGEKMGFTVKNIDNRAGHIEWGEGEKLFGILAHLDVVPAGDGWIHQPFGGEIDEGSLFGRGVQDDKGAAMAALYAMYSLKSAGFTPNQRVRLILGCDEESGWSCINRYFETEEMPSAGFSPDGDFPIINSEKGVLHLSVTYAYADDPDGKFRLKSIGAGNRVNMVPDKAYAEFELDGREHTLSFEGKSAHGSTPSQGESAVFPLIKKLVECSGHPVLEEILTYLVENEDGAKLGLNAEDESGALTMNFGTLSFDGESITVGVDIRHPFSLHKDKVLEIIGEKVSGKVVVLNEHRPLFVPEDSALVVTLKQAYEAVTGQEAFCLAIGGATYARALDNAVAFGPIFPNSESTIHMSEEHMKIAEIQTMYEIYREALKRLFSE